MTKLFVLGATGYIGGSVFPALLAAHPELEVTALVRKPENGIAVQALRPSPPIRIVVGSKTDLELIAAEAKEADIVLGALDCDDVPLTQAVLKGLEERAASKPAVKPALISTSGTGVTEVGNNGNFKEGPMFDDSDPHVIKSIPDKNIHRPVDNEIFAAQARGNILTYLIAPSVIYGAGHGPSRQHSLGLQFWVQLALKYGGTPVVNEGTAVWSDVHIEDLVDLYAHVFERALKDSTSSSSSAVAPVPDARAGDDLPESAYENFYFCSSQPFIWRDIAQLINDELIKLGKLPATAKIVGLSEEEPLMWWARTNTRPLPTRGEKEFGWKPYRPSFAETLASEMEYHLLPLSR